MFLQKLINYTTQSKMSNYLLEKIRNSVDEKIINKLVELYIPKSRKDNITLNTKASDIDSMKSSRTEHSIIYSQSRYFSTSTSKNTIINYKY